MTKIKKNSLDKLTDKDNKTLTGIAEDLVFLPSPKHRQVKSKFWTRYDSLNIDPDQISAAAVVDITGEPAVSRWWHVPGFKAWFLNEDEARERLEYLYMLALDSAEEVLLNPEAQANAKVQMVKVIAQLAGKEPKGEKYADEDIQRLSPEKLRAYIEKTAPRLLNKPDNKDDE